MGLKMLKIGITNEKISGRGGLSLFLRYFDKKGGYNVLSSTMLQSIPNCKKGLQLNQFLKQIIVFFIYFYRATMILNTIWTYFLNISPVAFVFDF